MWHFRSFQLLWHLKLPNIYEDMIDVSVSTCCKLKLVFHIFFYIMVRLLVLSDKDLKTVGTLSYFFIMILARRKTCINLNVCQSKTLWCIYLSQLTLQSLNLSFLTLHGPFAFLHLICQFKVLFVSCCWALAMGNKRICDWRICNFRMFCFGTLYCHRP